MTRGDLVRPTERFFCETTGVPQITEQDILRINRLFETNAGERAALECPTTGKLICRQVPTTWLQPVIDWEENNA